MRRIKYIVLSILFSLAWLMPASALAVDQSSFGGNNSSDYQPPTGNPQTNVPTSLQPTNTAVQPVTTLNQQALIQNGALSVLTAPDHGASSTAPDPGSPKKPKSALPVWIIGGLLTLAAVVYILFKPDREMDAATPEIVVALKPADVEKLKVAKKPAKKTNRKKKKTNRR